jgi:asparagine synthase (glutamine-hydrolysing)
MIRVVCGICGIIDFDHPGELDIVKRMMAELQHRGPDAEGAFADKGVALGFRRLAILDLSPAGNQPFASADGRLQLVHNGEIYNYRELRRELEAKGHVFRTATDTEVILAAYVEWGQRCVERFNGMWAFALWDGARRRLFCARDRFGVKPFYYRLDGARFSFASEPKAFRVVPRAPYRPNMRVVREYLEQGWLDQGSETFFDGIVRLPPAHTLVLDEHGPRLTCFWRLEPHEPPSGDTVEAVRELFFDTVRLHLRSDVAVGTCLSGGIDSSAIAVVVGALLRTERETALAVGPRQRTFTAYFEDPGFDERPFARDVVDCTAAEPAWITFDDGDLVADLPAIVEAHDEPFGSTSMAAQWYVMRAAKRAGLTVMLDGQGGDETLGGYRAFIGFHLADLLAGARVCALARELRAFRSEIGAGNLAVALARPFAPESVTRAVRARVRGAAKLVHPSLRSLPMEADENGSSFTERLRQHQQLLLTRRGLPELLRYEDRNSMAHSLEARVPFLDHRLVDLLFSLPGDELIRSGETKSILRRALADLLPESVRARRDKLGFVTPTGRFLRGALGRLAEEVFASKRFADRGFVDGAAARERLARHRAGELDAGFELWRALNLELWARAFLDSTPVH